MCLVQFSNYSTKLAIVNHLHLDTHQTSFRKQPGPSKSKIYCFQEEYVYGCIYLMIYYSLLVSSREFKDLTVPYILFC
jgi:hypothetical protein